ncbi:MAG: aspartate 1-decarboxylase [FCB group bacterium]|nr:aspartate 1-decarboxylase [FCB group bacterium]
MYREYLRAKIHEAVVTKADADCDGSIGIDLDILDRADIGIYEKVLVADCDNGNRFETYVVAAPRGSGEINILGATAQLSEVGHAVNILAFGFTEYPGSYSTPKIVTFK